MAHYAHDFFETRPQTTIISDNSSNESRGTLNPFFRGDTFQTNVDSRRHQQQQRPHGSELATVGRQTPQLPPRHYTQEPEQKYESKSIFYFNICFIFLTSLTTLFSLLAFFFTYIPIRNDFNEDLFKYDSADSTNEVDVDINIGLKSFYHLITDFLIFLLLSITSCAVVAVPYNYHRGTLSGSLMLGLNVVFAIMLLVQLVTIIYSRSLDIDSVVDRYEESDFFFRANLCQIFEEVDANDVDEEILLDEPVKLCQIGEIMSIIALLTNLATVILGFCLGCLDLRT